MYLELDVNTFRRNFQLAALGDRDRLGGLIASRGLDLLDLVNNVIALEDFAEDNVSTVEPTVIRC
jgi:hypothetical protein